MEGSEQGFQQAWHQLTTDGEVHSLSAPAEFVPVGIRKDVREAGPLYHGTKAHLKVGDLIEPGFPSNYGSRQKARFVYATARKEGAALAAQLAVGEGRGWVYLVEPVGPLEDDPNVTDQKFPGNPTRSYRTRQPLRVVGQVDDWEELAPQVIAKIKKRMEEAAQLGIEAINQ